MKKYARIENSAVVELFETDGDIRQMFHSDLVWVDVTAIAGIAEGWIKGDSGFAPEPAAPTPVQDCSALRSQAYRDESDPLFFKSQRGEATTQEWLDKVAEIKARWPE